ncbi:hypothetical protein EB001_14910 [bacterium]|nr:hypothetical protein [bacterium]
MKTEQEKLEWEKQAYGMSKAQLFAMVKEQAFPGTEIMFAAGMLSDAQEVISADLNNGNDGWVSPQQANQARQFINCAKAIIFDMLNKENA